MPPAPPTFSTITFWPSSSPTRAAMMRPSTSVGPPAANGMTIVSVRFGKSCAPAAPATLASANTAPSSNLRINHLDRLSGIACLDGDLDGTFGTCGTRRQGALAVSMQPTYERNVSSGGLMSEIRVAIAGLGAIGRSLARGLAAGVPGVRLACAAVRDRAKAQAWLDEQKIDCPLVNLDDVPQHADLAVECAPAAVFEAICRPMLAAGKRVMVLSVGALLPRPELIELAKSTGGQIIVPTGALL